MSPHEYAKQYHLPATRGQVRRALQARFSGGEFAKNSVRLVAEQVKIVYRVKLPQSQQLKLERLLTLYYMQINDTKKFFELMYTL